MSGTGAAYPCSKGGECDTTGSGVGGDMLALCPLLWHLGLGLSSGRARKVQLLLTRTQCAAREQLALAREGKVS